MNSDPRSFQRQARVISYVIIAGLILLAGYLVMDIMRHAAPPAPFEFSEATYLPTNPNLCPGQRLEWKSGVIVHEAPTVLVSAKVIWDKTLQRSVAPGDHFDIFVWTPDDIGKPITRLNTYPLPSSLAPGLYELRVGASSMVSAAQTYRVPFMVPNTCPKGGQP